jgi:hypothetical protein
MISCHTFSTCAVPPTAYASSHSSNVSSHSKSLDKVETNFSILLLGEGCGMNNSCDVVLS